MNVSVVTPSGVTPSDAKTCMVAVHVPAGELVGISCENDTAVGVVLIADGTLTMLYTVVPCCRVIAHTTLPLDDVV